MSLAGRASSAPAGDPKYLSGPGHLYWRVPTWAVQRRHGVHGFGLLAFASGAANTLRNSIQARDRDSMLTPTPRSHSSERLIPRAAPETDHRIGEGGL